MFCERVCVCVLWVRAMLGIKNTLFWITWNLDVICVAQSQVCDWHVSEAEKLKEVFVLFLQQMKWGSC